MSRWAVFAFYLIGFGFGVGVGWCWRATVDEAKERDAATALAVCAHAQANHWMAYHPGSETDGTDVLAGQVVESWLKVECKAKEAR